MCTKTGFMRRLVCNDIMSTILICCIVIFSIGIVISWDSEVILIICEFLNLRRTIKFGWFHERLTTEGMLHYTWNVTDE